MDHTPPEIPHDERAPRAASIPARRPSRAKPARPRIVGLDYARFIALIGMMAAHVWMLHADGTTALADDIVSGKAAALFAVLAGVGIALTSRSYLAADRVWAARGNLFGRGLAIIVIGLTLSTLGSGGVVVILVYYGVMFWVATVFVRWSNRMLLLAAGILAVAWPFVSVWLRTGMAQPFELGGATWFSLADPAAFLRGLFLTGTYPVPTWIVYALVGMVIGRAVIAAADTGALRRVATRAVAAGAALIALGWGVSALASGPLGGLAAVKAHVPGTDAGVIESTFFGTGMGAPGLGTLWWLVSPAPHSGTTFDLAITSGIALAVIGLCLLLGTVLESTGLEHTVLGNTVRRILEPVRRAGAAPLTIYSAHVLAVGAATTVFFLTVRGDALEHAGIPWYISSGPLWVLHVAGAVLIGAVLAILDKRGPLETLVTWSGRRFARAKDVR